MKRIENLTSIDGRKLLYDIYHELKYDKQLSGFSTLVLTWKICTKERDVNKIASTEATITHPLGFFSGTALWLEEIVNRYYFSTINSFVYLGAALLLILIGIRRFSDNVSNDLVIFGVIFEAMMLVLMFFTMLFTPQEDLINNNEYSNGNNNGSADELLVEVGEIARDFAATSVRFELMSESLKEMLRQHKEIITSTSDIARSLSQASSPNPDLINIMRNTNDALLQFKSTVEQLNSSAALLKKEMIDSSVKAEIERLFHEQFARNGNNTID